MSETTGRTEKQDGISCHLIWSADFFASDEGEEKFEKRRKVTSLIFGVQSGFQRWPLKMAFLTCELKACYAEINATRTLQRHSQRLFQGKAIFEYATSNVLVGILSVVTIKRKWKKMKPGPKPCISSEKLHLKVSHCPPTLC